MKILAIIQEKIDALDAQTFKIYALTATSIFLVLAGLIMFRNYRAVKNRQLKLNAINEQREELNSILMRYEHVKQQKAAVDSVLAQNVDFKIKEYADTTLQQAGLTDKQSQEAELTSEELANGYTEIKLQLRLANITMQNIVQLIDALEKNARIYTKNMEIYRATNSALVNLNLLLATLEPRESTTSQSGA
jgi:type II secretory pathway component PulM